jgi:hypothetical protein
MIYLLPYEHINHYYRDEKYIRRNVKEHTNYFSVWKNPDDSWVNIGHFLIINKVQFFKSAKEAKENLDLILISLGYVLIPEDKIDTYKLLI